MVDTILWPNLQDGGQMAICVNWDWGNASAVIFLPRDALLASAM